jgi:hypothetical protein
MGYFTILAAIPGFFLISLIFMYLWDVIAPRVGPAKDIDYVTAMLITITTLVGRGGQGRQSITPPQIISRSRHLPQYTGPIPKNP